jgi:hypothetical protein
LARLAVWACTTRCRTPVRTRSSPSSRGMVYCSGSHRPTAHQTSHTRRLGRSRLEPPQRPREHVRAAAPAVLSRDELVADPDRRGLIPGLDYSGSLNESLRPVQSSPTEREREHEVARKPDPALQAVMLAPRMGSRWLVGARRQTALGLRALPCRRRARALLLVRCQPASSRPAKLYVAGVPTT